ncbi:hypothetical protein FOL47_009546 [Perkinsus chesapeaki]|uniref:Tubulin/FtsZ GTPase domain-containing protein n=1 Tax=Perkinsus chesapeaki TaxID=330153 RepID=A0A7J6L7N8_PERCH|nr:hypothetical protein FOL47_009546 [Perkinsus chesapeaki]
MAPASSNVVIVQIGQCGNQVGETLYDCLWEEICELRKPGGNIPLADRLQGTFFDDNDGARAALIDMEPKVVQSLLSRKRGNPWRYGRDRCLYLQSGSGNSWMTGYSVLAKAQTSELAADVIRQAAEACDRVDAFLMLSSGAGGTGSGYGSFVVSEILNDYHGLKHGSTCSAIVCPFERGEVSVQNYNTALSLTTAIETGDLTMTFSNTRLENEVGARGGGLATINRKLARTLVDSLLVPSRVAPYGTLSELSRHLLADPDHTVASCTSLPNLDYCEFSSDTWFGLSKELGDRWKGPCGTALVHVCGTGADKLEENVFAPFKVKGRYFSHVARPLRLVLNPIARRTPSRSISVVATDQEALQPLAHILSRCRAALSTGAFVHHYGGYEGEARIADALATLNSPAPTAVAPTARATVTTVGAANAPPIASRSSTIAAVSTVFSTVSSSPFTPTAAASTASQSPPAAAASPPPPSSSPLSTIPPSALRSTTAAPTMAGANAPNQADPKPNDMKLRDLIIYCFLIALAIGGVGWGIVILHDRWRDHYRVPGRHPKYGQGGGSRSKRSDSQRSWNESTDTGGNALPSEVTSFDEGPPSTRRVPHVGPIKAVPPQYQAVFVRYVNSFPEFFSVDYRRSPPSIPASSSVLRKAHIIREGEHQGDLRLCRRASCPKASAKLRCSSSPPGVSPSTIDRSSYDETALVGRRGAKSPVSETDILVHDVPTTSSESYEGVKEEVDDDDSCCGSSSSERRCLTTVMLRNIPSRYSTKDLCEILHRDGFEAGSHYDFVYLPADFRDYSCLGYGFVNFTAHSTAKGFSEKFQGLRLPYSGSSDKICQTSWARIQGFSENIRHAQHSANHDLPPFFRPMAFSCQGAPIALDEVLADSTYARTHQQRGRAQNQNNKANGGSSRTSQMSRGSRADGSSGDRAKDNDDCKFFLGGLPSEMERPDWSKKMLSSGLTPYLPTGVVVLNCALLSVGPACSRYAFVTLSSADAVTSILEKYYFSPQPGEVGIQIDGFSVSLKPYRRRRHDSFATSVASRRVSKSSVASTYRSSTTWRSSPKRSTKPEM